MHRFLNTFPIGLLASYLLLAGCGQYDIKVNDKLVYTPAKLLQVQGITDPALAICIEQAIADNLITSVTQLKALNCSNAGIKTLDGLAAFHSLEQLKLSNNQIRNLLELEKLTLLVNLWLDDNVIVDIVPLAGLARLAQLDVSNNPALQCPTRELFSPSVAVTLADHCQAP